MPNGTLMYPCEENRLKDGDYVPGRYIYADKILTHVVQKKRFQNYDYYIGKIPGRNLITDGTHFAHCKDIRNGLRDLRFKTAEERGAEQYLDIDIDDMIPTEDMVTMYRIITGACRQGTEQFLKSLGKLKKSYTVREAIQLTEGQYGANIFRKYFS